MMFFLSQDNVVSKGLLTSTDIKQKYKLTHSSLHGCGLSSFTDETDETEQLKQLTGISLAEGRTVNHAYSTCESCGHLMSAA